MDTALKKAAKKRKEQWGQCVAIDTGCCIDGCTEEPCSAWLKDARGYSADAVVALLCFAHLKAWYSGYFESRGCELVTFALDRYGLRITARHAP